MAFQLSTSASATLLLLLILFTNADLIDGLSVVGRVRLKLGFGKSLREKAVSRYFEGGMSYYMHVVCCVCLELHCLH